MGTSTRNIVHVVTDVITNDVTDEIMMTNEVKWVIALCPYIEMLLSSHFFPFVGIKRTYHDYCGGWKSNGVFRIFYMFSYFFSTWIIFLKFWRLFKSSKLQIQGSNLIVESILNTITFPVWFLSVNLMAWESILLSLCKPMFCLFFSWNKAVFSNQLEIW